MIKTRLQSCPHCGASNRYQSVVNNLPLLLCGQCKKPLPVQPGTPLSLQLLVYLLILLLTFICFPLLKKQIHPDLARLALMVMVVASTRLAPRVFRHWWQGLALCTMVLLLSHSGAFGDPPAITQTATVPQAVVAESVATIQPPLTLDIADPHLRYIEAVDARAPTINTLASQLVRNCNNSDKGCEADSIARYVADSVAYRTDPGGGEDYIKPPLQTLDAMAGDCEDKTILAASLMETLGIRTLMVFEKQHTYPMACFDRIEGGLLSLPGNIIEGHGYCYALEPTAPGSGLGMVKDLSLIEAAYSVRDKKRLPPVK